MLTPEQWLEQVRGQEAAGRLPRAVCFWKPTGGPEACLSQWWPSPMHLEGRDYLTAEHWMMWSKAELFGDTQTASAVLAAQSPPEAMALGRAVRGFDPQVWRAHRFAVVVAGNRAKFEQHEDARAFLLGTRDALLVEASPQDRIWGVGLPARDPKASRPSGWRGTNLLGLALMEVRRALQST